MNCVCVDSGAQYWLQTFLIDNIDWLVKQVCYVFLDANVVDDRVDDFGVEVHEDIDVAFRALLTAGYRSEQCRVNDPERSQVGLALL
jgi:hypothetical protein